MSNLSRYWPIFLFLALAVNAANPCIDINTASKQDLEKIKHIGEARAEQVIKLRGEKLFSSVDELSRVIGLGPARISDIKKEGLACISGEPASAKAMAGKAKELAAISEPIAIGQNDRSFYPLFAAFALAIFSGFVILILKKHVRT